MGSKGLEIQPRISVLLPVYNGAAYLKECLDSVHRQSFEDFELLISDDSSQDASRDIIRQFSDPRIRPSYHERNVGLFKNLNFLLREARAPLVRFLCQDDILEQGCLKTEVQFFDSHPDIGISFCKSRTITSSGKEIQVGALEDMPAIIPPLLSLQLFFYYGCIPGNLSTVCIRKQSFEKIGFFNESLQLAGDYDLWVRVCQKENLGVIHKHLVQLRHHPKQLSRQSSLSVKFIEEVRRIRSTLFPLLPNGIRFKAKLYEKLRQNVLDTHHAYHCLSHGRFKDWLRVVKLLGVDDFALGTFFWVFTMNNRFYKPRPKFIHPDPTPIIKATCM